MYQMYGAFITQYISVWQLRHTFFKNSLLEPSENVNFHTSILGLYTKTQLMQL